MRASGREKVMTSTLSLFSTRTATDTEHLPASRRASSRGTIWTRKITMALAGVYTGPLAIR
jgi:hypothetical protein